MERKNSNTPFIILVVILLISNIAFAWLYFKEKNVTKTLIVEVADTNQEKDKITDELNSLLVEYDELKTNNDTLNKKLASEQARILELVEEIKKVKNASSAQIAQYKKELNTLRNIMKSFITQIDSLNTRNQVLTAENIKVKTEFIRAQDVNKKLTEKNEDLSNKVTIASVIKAANIVATPLNKRGKDVTKASKTEKIQVCFKLTENDIAKAGTREVFVRIARPDELVLASSEENFFNFQGSKIVYTSKREVDYQNKAVDMCIYWQIKEELIPGKYSVDIFTDSQLIGSASFDLK